MFNEPVFDFFWVLLWLAALCVFYEIHLAERVAAAQIAERRALDDFVRQFLMWQAPIRTDVPIPTITHLH